MSQAKIGRAKATAASWAQMHRDHLRTPDYSSLPPTELIRLAESTKALKPAEVEALDAAWLATFGEPLCAPDGSSHDGVAPHAFAEDKAAPIADDTMLPTKEVLRLTGISLSSLKRMVIAARFPKPMRLSPRKLGWPARDVKAWLDTLDEQRKMPRQ